MLAVSAGIFVPACEACNVRECAQFTCLRCGVQSGRMESLSCRLPSRTALPSNNLDRSRQTPLAAIGVPAASESAPLTAPAGVELTVPGKQIVLDAMAEGLLLNCTHETVLRFLLPYVARRRRT